MKSGILLGAAGIALMCCMDSVAMALGAILIVGVCLINLRRSAAGTPVTS